MAKREIVRRTAESVAAARELTEDVEFSPEDGSRTEPDFLAEVVETAIEAGASTVNIPDTVGYTMPAEFSALIGHLRRTVPNIGKAVISVHCHDDLGMAVANSLAAVGAGARQVECTVNGIGERAGNASLEEVVMSLRTRRDLFAVTTGIDTREIFPSSQLLSEITGMVVQRNRPSWGKTHSPTRQVSISTECCGIAPPTKSCIRTTWGWPATSWFSVNTAAGMPSARGWANSASRRRTAR